MSNIETDQYRGKSFQDLGVNASKYITIVETDAGVYFNYKRNGIEFNSDILGAMESDSYSQLEPSEALRLLRSLVARHRIRNCALPRDNLRMRGAGYILSLIQRKKEMAANRVFEEKSPQCKYNHVGVEIEFLCDMKQKWLGKKFAEAGLSEFIHLKTDSSVSGDGGGDCDGGCRDNCECMYCVETHPCENGTDCPHTLDEEGCVGHCTGRPCYGYVDHEDFECNCECNCNREEGHEIAIIAKTTEITGIVTKVCAILADSHATVNSTCGLHVHLDMRGHRVAKCFENLVKASSLLYSMVPASRRKSSYCAPNISSKMGDYETRYWGINPMAYKSHNTLEVRLHSGTINAVKINHWIRLLQVIAYSKKPTSVIGVLSDLTSKIRLSAELTAYICKRLAQFESEHAGTSYQVKDDTQITEQLQMVA